MTDQNNTLNGIKEIEDSIHSFKSIENMELSTHSIGQPYSRMRIKEKAQRNHLLWHSLFCVLASRNIAV